jgi:hypothetical protein
VKDIKLPSGAILKITDPPWAVALGLREAMAEEMKSIGVDSGMQVSKVMKDVICTAMSSQKVKAAMWECFARCMYDGGNGMLKIDQDTFEPVKARQDYDVVCVEVAQHVLAPFGKEGFAKFAQILGKLFGSLE